MSKGTNSCFGCLSTFADLDDNLTARRKTSLNFPNSVISSRVPRPPSVSSKSKTLANECNITETSETRKPTGH